MTENKAAFHEPQHPLPEEIQKMQKDETVCKYCGVSYLIHREIKVLQDQLKAVTKELEQYKGLESREKELQKEIEEKNVRIAEVEDQVKQRDAVVSELNNQTQDLANSLVNEIKAQKELENKLAEGAMELKQVRLKNESLVRKLPSIQEALAAERNNLNNIKTEILSDQEAMKTFYQAQLTEVLQVIHKLGNERSTKLGEMSELQSKLEICHKNENELRRLLNMAMEEVKTLKVADSQGMSHLKKNIQEVKNREADLQLQLRDMSNEVQQLQSTLKDLEKHNSNEKEKYNALSCEVEQFKTKLSHREQEVDALTSQLRNNDILHEQSVKKLENVISQRENSLQEKTKAWDELRKKLHKQEQQEQVALQQASASSVQADDLKSEAERIRKDCEALKAEREMMIIAHQNQIQDLRNSFRNKMEEMQGWPEKLDRALRQERDKHKKDLENLESKFKENFTMELEIEKQKFEKMYNKNVADLKDSESKLTAELSAIQARHRAEITDIHKQTADVKKRSRENENVFRDEVSGLKRIIAELEGRLGKLGIEDATVAISLKAEVKELERTIEEQKVFLTQLEQNCDSQKEQIKFLEETVRKECEERFELTEALSATKEELLMLKRPSRGYQSVNRSASSTPTRRNSEVPGMKDKLSEDLTHFQKSNSLKSLNTGGPYPPSKPRDFVSDKEIISSNNLQVGFEGDRAKTPSSGVHGSNLSSRRR